jgi:hypothetical protein
MRYTHQPHNKQHGVTILALALVLIAGFFAYDFLDGKRAGAADDDAVQPAVADTTAPGVVAPLNTEQIALLTKIENIKLEGAILKDPVFLMLQDKMVEITPQDIGKPNPFAPLAGETKPATTKKTR